MSTPHRSRRRRTNSCSAGARANGGYGCRYWMPSRYSNQRVWREGGAALPESNCHGLKMHAVQPCWHERGVHARHARTHTHTHAHTHARTHMHTHAHTRARARRPAARLTQVMCISRYAVTGGSPTLQRSSSGGTGTSRRALPSSGRTVTQAEYACVQTLGGPAMTTALRLPLGDSEKYHRKSSFQSTSMSMLLPYTVAVKCAVVRSPSGHVSWLRGQRRRVGCNVI